MRARRIFVVALALGFASHLAIAAPPTVPASLPYQGLLLDGLGAPRTGSVDLVVRIWDAVLGGTLVYKQSFPNVALADGVFSVQLGPAGEGSDAPSNPLTTDLATALAGDAGITAPVRFLEVTVGSDGALTRTQILSSAYALRATSAATADTATTATTAGTADDTDAVAGRSSLFFQQWFESTYPRADDPLEGLLDSDGDGKANFLEGDNDDDGLGDDTELAQGSSPNLITPRPTSVAPNSVFYTSSQTVTVSGTGFLPGLTAVLGSQTPTPSNVTPTSFNITIGPQDPGFPDLTVTNANGENGTLADAVVFSASIAHSVPMGANQTTFAARLGTQILALGGRKQYGVGTQAQSLFTINSVGTNGQFGIGWSPSGALAAIRCQGGSSSCIVDIAVDSDGDFNLTEEPGIPIETLNATAVRLQAAEIATDPSGRWVAGYVRDLLTSEVVVAHDRNGDGDFGDANEVSLVDAGIGANVVPADLAVDSSGRPAYAYATGTQLVRYAWDRDGDGAFAAGEVTTLSTLGSSCVGTTFDSADRPVVVYSSGATITLARDQNLDGDFQDAGESTTIAGWNAPGCDVQYRPGQPLAVAHSGTPLVQLRLDRNDDGDFDDADETTVFDRQGNAELEMTLNGVDRACIATSTHLLFGQTD